MVFRACFLVLSLLVGCGCAVAQELAVEWRVARPFPFFQDDEVYRYHLDTWRALPSDRRSIGELERALNEPVRLRAWTLTIETLRARVALGWADRVERAVWYVTRQGWASVTIGRTIWDERAQRHNAYQRSRFSVRNWRRAYVAPEGHEVLLRLTAPREGDCVWTAARAVLIDRGDRLASRMQRPCRDEVGAYVPFDAEAGRTTAIEVETADGRGRADVRVRDLFVVGMGDSFASGEGNPERPVVLDRNASVFDGPAIDADGNRQLDTNGRLRFDNDIGVPVRHDVDGPNLPADWLDRLCHRSVYSQQLRTALHLALSDEQQHTAVTFLHYACSGAQVGWGVLGRFEGVERVDPRHIDRSLAMESQFAKLAADLCEGAPGSVDVALPAATRLFWPRQVSPGSGAAAPTDAVRRYRVASCARPMRRVDLLLMSVGGNDIGFAQLVANAVTNPDHRVSFGPLKLQNLRSLLVEWRQVIELSEAEARLVELPNRLRALYAALQSMAWLRRGEAGAIPVVWSAYPPVERTGPGVAPVRELCRDTSAGMTISPVFRLDVGILEDTSVFTDRLLERMRDDIAGLQGARPIRLVDGFRPDFMRHGFCVVRSGPPRPADRVVLPGLHQGDAQSEDVFHWRGGVNPREHFRPYASRGRWVRTFDDAYMIANTSNRGWLIEDELGAREAGRVTGARRYAAGPELRALLSTGGPMHPTAEGHAEMADHVVSEAERTLRAFGR